ncbi:MAG: putative two-component response regulator protein [Devosia sp.]|nr:putative two-component response regulator protein [Devosia sp.]
MPGNAAVVLLLEDEAMIAIDIERALAKAGFDVSTVASCAEAFEWLAVCRPDLVIVDIVLHDGPCHSVVEQLVADRIHFLVHSGDIPDMHADTELSKGTWIRKPSDGAMVLKAVRKLVEV